jgi:hypothetical protein
MVSEALTICFIERLTQLTFTPDGRGGERRTLNNPLSRHFRWNNWLWGLPLPKQTGPESLTDRLVPEGVGRPGDEQQERHECDSNAYELRL